ncbi:class I SAM-dependent methyltransferase [Streptomyces sp. CS131]|uniref:class I SAM-dependent methyltransferase n=1 Tax=Streptomyces sp. CS131 TaxID=2162711 RepID=UPI001EF43307|nr:class I SAM-dependent methyltransferase [Streptomyces sp. CS131]
MSTDGHGSIYDRGEMYEAFYRGRGKDYTGEAALVTSLVRDRLPEADSLLDVACGSGDHLSRFAGSFGHVEGLDLSEDMVQLARKNTGVPIHRGDMRDFTLDRTFGAVVSMFSGVAYCADVDELGATLRSFARHLSPGGVIVIEPFWLPEDFLEGYVGTDTVESGGRTYVRVSHSVRDGGVSHMEVHYLVASAESGVTHFSDVHRTTLFTRDEYESAFARAGCEVEYVKDPLAPRGLFVGTTAPAA